MPADVALKPLHHRAIPERFQVREDSQLFGVKRFVVFDSRDDRIITRRDNQRTAAALARTLNHCWAEVRELTK